MHGSIEGRLRALPGVLDCSLTEAGVALLLHPEVDARVVQARAHAVFVELGDRRPLMIIGGLAPSGTRTSAGAARFDATPLSLTVFTVVVLCLLAPIPLAPGRDSVGEPPAASPQVEFAIASSFTPELFRPAPAVARTRRGAGSQPAAAAASPVPLPPPDAASTDSDTRDAARGRPAAKPRPVPARRTVAVELAPSLAVSAPVCTPGRSAGHRAAVKAPLPSPARSTACG